MGMSMTPVPVFDEGITIHVQGCSELGDLCQKRTLRDFANGRMMSLYRFENGDLYCRRSDGRFIQGKECPRIEEVYIVSDGHRDYVSAPAGFERCRDGSVRRSPLCGPNCGPEMTRSIERSYRFRSHRSAAVQANKIGLSGQIQRVCLTKGP